MPPIRHMTREEYTAKRRAEAERIASEILNGQTGPLKGAFELAANVTDDVDDDDISLLEVIVSEFEHLPVGKSRKYWSESALQKKDEEIGRIDGVIREKVFDVCRRILERPER